MVSNSKRDHNQRRGVVGELHHYRGNRHDEHLPVGALCRPELSGRQLLQNLCDDVRGHRHHRMRFLCFGLADSSLGLLPQEAMEDKKASGGRWLQRTCRSVDVVVLVDLLDGIPVPVRDLLHVPWPLLVLWLLLWPS